MLPVSKLLHYLRSVNRNSSAQSPEDLLSLNSTPPNQGGEQPSIQQDYKFIPSLEDESVTYDKTKKNKPRTFLSNILDFIGIFIFAVVGTFLVKTFLFQIFLIPSGSMEDTLQIGDHVIVNRLADHFTPIARGEIVVFEDPDNWMNLNKNINPSPVRKVLQFLQLRPDETKPLLIKRVIGIGGDTVVCCSPNGYIVVNGYEINEPYIHNGSSPSDIEFSVKVPKGLIFVMGDHRDNSSDSRFHFQDTHSGFVPEKNILGRAVFTIRSRSFIFLDRATALSDILPNKDYTKN